METARTHAVADVIVHEARRGGYGHSAKWEDAVKFSESIIDAEFAALRARLKSANEVILHYARHDALTSQQQEHAISFLNQP